MVLESSQEPVKRWRWRPRKIPVEQTVAKQHDKSTEVVKKKSIQHNLTREDELAAFERRSNKSGILTLLILLLWVALIWYGMYLKINQVKDAKLTPVNLRVTKGQSTNQWDLSENMPEGKTAPHDADTSIDTKDDPATGEVATDNIIFEYFSRINNDNVDALDELEDSSFTSLATLRNYFNKQRLTTFAKNIEGNIRIENMREVTNDPVLRTNPTAKAYDFSVEYTLATDKKHYSDDWRAYTVQKTDGKIVVNGFVYDGNNVSESPFFQFSKFNIK